MAGILTRPIGLCLGFATIGMQQWWKNEEVQDKHIVMLSMCNYNC